MPDWLIPILASVTPILTGMVLGIIWRLIKLGFDVAYLKREWEKHEQETGKIEDKLGETERHILERLARIEGALGVGRDKTDWWKR